MVDALLCDLDGVLRFWPAIDVARIERDHNLPQGAIARVAFDENLLPLATHGLISDEEWRRQAARTLALAHGRQAVDAVTAWSELVGLVDDEMLELLQEVRRTVPVVLLTNATTRLARDLRVLGLEAAFDAIANSASLGIAKPEPDAFRRGASLVGAELERCALVDDQETHIVAARSLGAVAIKHETVSHTRGALAVLGLV